MEDSENNTFEFEQKSSFSFSKSWAKMKTAMMGTLFVMANDMELSYTMNLLAILIDFLQMLAFPFNQNSGFPWNSKFTNWLVVLCNNIQLEFYISAVNPLQNLIIFIISVFIVFLNLIVIGIVAYRFINKKAQNVFLLKMLRSVTSLLTTIFFMPVLSIFILICSCSLNRSSSASGCPSDESKILLVLSVIFSVLLCLVSLVVSASFYELDYKSDDASARPHARIELIYLLVKMYKTIIFKMWEQSSYHLIQICSILGGGVLMTYLYIFYLPFYDYRTSVFQAQCVALYTWSGVCLLLAMVGNDPNDAGPAMLFYLGSVCIWILTKDTCDWRKRKLIEKNIYTVQNPYQVELHARFTMLERAGTYKITEEQVLAEAEDFYYQAERKFPDSSLLKIFVAQFHLTYRDRQEAIPKLEQAEQRSPALDEQFIIYKTRQNVGKDAITLVTFTSYLEASSKSEIQSLACQLEFWRVLSLKSSTNDELLINLSKNITKNIDTSYNNYKFMLSIDRTHKKMVPMYVYFMEDVFNRVDGEVKNLKNRFRDMDNHANTRIIVSNKFEQQPRISISLEKSNFGRIDKVNAEMMSWIRMPKAKIMNQRIDSLMPYYFGQCFISYLSEIKEKWDDIPGPPPVELYFIDNDEQIIGCTCNFIPETEDTSNRFQGKTTQSSMNLDSRSNSFIPKTTTILTQGKQYENWHRPINCVLVPRDETDSIIFISSENIILGYNAKASAFFGINNEMIGLKNIKDFIPNFKGLFERANRNYGENTGMLLELLPVQTFLISNSGTFSRIRISINSFSVDNNVYNILIITEPGSYSKPTQRFFGLFIKFLEVYLKKAGHLDALVDSNDESEDQSTRINRLMSRVRKEVEMKNTQKSPELHYLSILMWIFMFLMMGAFGGSYAVSVLSFNNYIDKIHQLDYITDIRVQSSLICTYIALLDMARQGLPIPDEPEQVVQMLKDASEVNLHKIEYLKTHSDIQDLKDNSLSCISLKEPGVFELTQFNPVNALFQQSSYALKMCEKGLETFDILNNSYAFWAFFNGKQVISYSLDDLSEQFVKSAENSRQAIEKWAYTFASIEIGLICAAMFLSLPLILKSEELNMKVIRVFYTLPSSILNYLMSITKIHLEMRKDKHYPDNRNRYQSAEDLWDEFLINNEKNRKMSLTRVQENPDYQVTCFKKFRAFYKNSFTKRLMIFCFISAGISWGLQTYVGVIMPTVNLNSAAMIIKNSGMVAAFQAQVSSSLICQTFLLNETETKKNFPSDSLIFKYPTVESSFLSAQNDSAYLQIFFSMLVNGNSSLGVSYNKMYSMQTQQFLKDFFPSNCPDYVSDCFYYSSVVSKGNYYTVHTSLFDSWFISSLLFAHSSETPAQRAKLTEDLLKPLLKLQYLFVNVTSYEIQQIIIDYYTGMVNNYNFIQTLVLIFYYIFSVSFMVFVFRRTLNYHERKKKMTRSMLLLLPHRIVEYSRQIQRALENMNYD